MVEPAGPELPPHARPELEARLAAFERAAPAGDFDGPSWFWMILLGIALPLVLLGVGWWA
jgi:hypothetical protein